MPRLQGAFSTVVHDEGPRRRLPRPGRPAAARARPASATATASPASRARSTSSAPSYLRDVQPGEIVSLAERGHRARGRSVEGAREAFCVFEYIYFARPDSRMNGDAAAGRARADGRDPRPRGAGAERRPRHRRARLGQRRRARLRARRRAAAGRRPHQEPLRRAHVHPARAGAAQARPAAEVQPAAGDRRRQVDRRRRRLDRARQHDAPDRADAARRRRARGPHADLARRRSSTRATTASTCPRARRWSPTAARSRRSPSELGCDSLAYLSLDGVYEAVRGVARARTATPASPASTRWATPRATKDKFAFERELPLVKA